MKDAIEIFRCENRLSSWAVEIGRRDANEDVTDGSRCKRTGQRRERMCHRTVGFSRTRDKAAFSSGMPPRQRPLLSAPGWFSGIASTRAINAR